MSTKTDFPYLDSSVRAQDDLNHHVNGEWLKTAVIPDDLDAYGSFLELRDKAEADVRAILEESAETAAAHATELDPEFGDVQQRIGTFYRAFMDAERAEELELAPIQERLDQIDSATTPGELVRLCAQWQRQGLDGLLTVGVTRDAGNPERELFHVMQGGLGLPDEAYYREDTYTEIRQKYQTHLESFLSIAGVANAAQAATAVFSLETDLASHHWDRVATRDAQKRYNLKSRSEVEQAMPLVTEAFQGWGLTDAQSAEIVVGQPNVLGAFQTALTDHPLDAWKHWLRVQLLRWAAPLLHAQVVEEHFDFYARTLNGTPQLKERWKRGVALTNAHLGEDVAQIYVARHYPQQAREAMNELVAALIEAYRRSITALDWMGEATRGKALDKLEAFTSKIGFPATWTDYSACAVAPDDLVGNVASAAEGEWDRDVAKIDDGPDPDEWHITPQTVNAYYHPLENVICFPAAILQLPFFSADRDMAQNFGAIGAVIGHEIGHGFDDQGSRYGADGSLTDWWTGEDRAAFEARTAQLVDQFSKLSPSVLDDTHTVNGELTLGENIGDLGGIGIAHKAYKLWLAARNQGVAITDVATPEDNDDDTVGDLTGDQRFFFAWAQGWRNVTRPERALTLLSIDPHSPAEFRATQPVKNIDAFHQAFGTSEGDGMYLPPDQRVTIW
ncbi:M13 family metallopeptidase [Nesterenkonia natronophila]|uniref:M13 family peptidase n=1 Tax=Nesterenkonia natronophila TaxID=2174932 RepID=A0A3A4F9X6_9MICC|nr:M13-type metalloendopeptidase [Nesterenkonia natronophila]RJN31624.1 M13 family peptidase [Nesterenkonia natronophila]